MGLENTRTIHRILIHRDNPEIVYVAAHGSAWGPSEERGVYKTINGGKSWERVLFTNNTSGCAELVADPSNPEKYFAAMWDYQRKPWTFRSGGPGSGMYVTLDGGKTWTKRTDKDGLPGGTLGRIGLAISRNKPNFVYAIVESKTIDLYRSTDGGYHWQKLSNDANLGNRPFYYNEIHCDPKNENRIYSLWSQISRSEDGGKTWQVLADWNQVHPDHRLKIGGVHLDQRFVAQDASVVDQHVHTAKGAHGRIDQGLRTLWRGDVVKIGQGSATGCGDLVHHDLCSSLVTALALDTATQIIDHHHRPALGQGQSMGSA
jgi:photosystem II stability/assembly factor-like uncharacterized protein